MSPRAFALVTIVLACHGSAAFADEGLSAEFVLGPGHPSPRARVGVPFAKDLDIALRITNTSKEPVQVLRSSYECYRYFKLDVVRVEPDGTRSRLPAHFDLYPLKDLAPPVRQHVTLSPGESVERDMSVLIREGYGLDTCSRQTSASHFRELRAQRFGALREPGVYEVVGRYTIKGSDRDVLFDGDQGRDPKVPIWAGTEARTEPLVLVVGPRYEWQGFARQTASASVVVLGTVKTATGHEKAAARKGGGHAALRIEVSVVLKGDAPRVMTKVLHHVEGIADSHETAGWIDEERIFFLYPAKEYFRTVGEPLEPTFENRDRVLALIRYHEDLSRVPPPASEVHLAGVRKILAGLTENPEAQAKGLESLEALGREAAPAIIAVMDDRRPLAIDSVTFENRGEGHFEAVRHYSPELVVDALAALLNQLTGQHFGLSYNDPTDAQRTREVAGWRVFAHYTGKR